MLSVWNIDFVFLSFFGGIGLMILGGMVDGSGDLDGVLFGVFVFWVRIFCLLLLVLFIVSMYSRVSSENVGIWCSNM